MIVVTTQEIPGCAIIGVLGAVIGVTARSRNPYVEGLTDVVMRAPMIQPELPANPVPPTAS